MSTDTLSSVVDRYVERTPRSRAAHERARALLPGGVNRTIVHHEPHPVFLARADGAWVTDLDGNRYLDALGNYTAMILGHGNRAVRDAVERQQRDGSAVALPSPREVEVAELLRERLPSIEQVRFTVSGTEATMMAIRAARAYTGRPLAAKFEGGYHGMHDYVALSVTPDPAAAGSPERPATVAPAGVPPGARDSVLVLPFNNPEAVDALLAEHGAEVAAVIVEPVMGSAGVIAPQPGFLERLREAADRHGIVLIFDEVMTLRLAYGGAQERFAVRPDLTTLAKVIGGGYPVAAVGGRREIMSVFDPATGPAVLFSGTWHAGPVCLAASAAALRQLDRGTVAALNARGDDVRARIGELLKGTRDLQVTGVGSLLCLHANSRPLLDYRAAAQGDRARIAALQLALLNEGVMIAPRGMFCLSVPMTDADLDHFVAALGRALAAVGEIEA